MEQEKKQDDPWNGGPAFPLVREYDAWDGMSLRDWFAGQALAGLLLQPAEPGFDPSNSLEVAEQAYILADSLLEYRKND